MENIQYITLDIMNNKTNNFIYTKQYDVGREVVFSFTDNGSPLTLTGLTVIFSMKKPDGKYITYSGSENMTVSASTVTLEFTEQMTVLYGKLPYQLSLVDGTPEEVAEGTATIISTVNGYIICDKAAVQREDLVSESDGSYAADVMTAHESVEAAVEAAEDAADYAKISKSYAVGGTDYQHDGRSDTQDNAKYYCETMDALYNRLFYSTKVTLLANAWSDGFQIVSCRGVLADEDQQLVVVRPYAVATPEYVDCGIACTAQGNNQLTFRCKEVPENDLDVYVMLQEALHPFTDFVGADGVHEGKAGLVPAPSAADNTKFLRGDGTWATISGGGGGDVTDVTVDGVSVVSGGVARIDFTGLQPLLSPGRNITISNGTISATDTKYDPFTGGTSGLVPSATPSDHGKYLKADGTWDTPSGGGGGSGAVDDVQVDGVSVVSNGVAYINLSGKQNTLIPGSNITISNNTISAIDSKVSQNLVSTATSSEYRLLLSGTPDDINRSEGTYKYTKLTYNPNTSRLKVTATDGDVSINGLSVSVNGILHGGCSLTMTGDDLTLSSSGNTQKWDGANTSLRTAIATLRADVDAGGSGGTVVQTATDTGNHNYELLFSNTADNTTRTEGARKSGSLYYNPSEKAVIVAATGDSTELRPWSLKLNSGLVYMEISYDDIRLSGQTWDGTNTSLYNTIFNKLSKSGGTMTGNIITPSDDGFAEYGIYPSVSNNGFVGSDTNYYYAMHSDHYNGIYFRAFEDDDFSTSDKYAQLMYNDIDLYGTSNNWDGVHTSLKAALAAKLSIDGGALEGTLTWESPSIYGTTTGTRIGTDSIVVSHDHGGFININTAANDAELVVSRYGYDEVVIGYDDIINSSLWDGTNDSLKNALTSLTSTGDTVKQNLSTYEDGNFPILLGYSTSGVSEIDEARKSYNLTYNPLYNRIRSQDARGDNILNISSTSIWFNDTANNLGLTINKSDVTKTGGTWDGTSSSLTTAVTNKLDKSGGVMTGNITWGSPVTTHDTTGTLIGIDSIIMSHLAGGTISMETGDDTASITFSKSNHMGTMTVAYNDIIRSLKWDGTNTSLVTAVTNAKSSVYQRPDEGQNEGFEILTTDSTAASSTSGVYKASAIKYNPSTRNLTLTASSTEGDPISGYKIATVTYDSMYSDRTYKITTRGSYPKYIEANIESEPYITISNEQLQKSMQIAKDDITLTGDTWNGTATSLKAAVGTVTQTYQYGGAGEYELLYAGTASEGHTSITEITRKDSCLTYNPSNRRLKIEYCSGGVGGGEFNEVVFRYDKTILSDTEIQVNRYANSSLIDSMNISNSDISNKSTWDGTNMSLKTTISALNTAISNVGTNVTQTASSANNYFPILFSSSSSSTDVTGVVYKNSELYYNPSTNTLVNASSTNTVTISGNQIQIYHDASTAADQYTMTVGYSDITYDKTWDGTNSSLKTALANKVSDVKIDNLSLVNNGVASIPTFQGSSKGLVPTATSADANKFLRGNGTWGTTAAISFPAANEWNWNVWRETYNYSWTAGTYQYIQCYYDKSTVDPTYGDLSDIKVLVQGVEVTGKDSNNQEHTIMGVLQSAVDLNGELNVYVFAYNHTNIDFVSYKLATTVTFVGDNYNG